MSSDAPNTFVQAKLNRKHGQARVIMKIAGVLVEPLMKKAPHTCKGFAVPEEMGHLHDQACFETIGVKDMTKEEKR